MHLNIVLLCLGALERLLLRTLCEPCSLLLCPAPTRAARAAQERVGLPGRLARAAPGVGAGGRERGAAAGRRSAGRRVCGGAAGRAAPAARVQQCGPPGGPRHALAGWLGTHCSACCANYLRRPVTLVSTHNCSTCLIVCWPGDLQRYITHGNWQIYCHVFSFDFSSEASKPLSCKPHTSRCASATLLMGARCGRRCAHGARRARSAGGPVAPAGHARRRGRHGRCSAASRRGRAGAVLLGRHAGRRSRPARCVRREQHHPSALPRA